MLPQAILLLGAAVLGRSQETSGCNDSCRKAYEAALAAEAVNWATYDVSNDPFYDTPGNYSASSKPGDLLRWQDLGSDQLASNWTLVPEGMSLSRFIYVTEDKDRRPIPSSGYVLLPYSVPDGRDTFRTLAWAHGTAGNGRKCAPSNNQRLDYSWMGPFLYASHGYAVVGTDYAGLGVQIPTAFQYEAGHLHAADVAYSVVAARKAVGHLLSEDWVVVGHSEGGMTAWRTNERLAMPDQDELLKAGRFLGAASIAPALQPIKLIPREIERAKGGHIEIVSVYLLQALSGLYPEAVKKEDYLTERALSLLPLIDEGCLRSGSTIMSLFNVSDIYKNTSWITGPAMQKWQREINGAGPHRLAGPMLVVQGDADVLTYAEFAEEDFDATCRQFPESSAEYHRVPGAGHGTSLEASALYYIPWIKALFEGRRPEPGCRKVTAKPVTDRFAKDKTGPLA
ncbi:hypothetical protein MCOR07_006781 [Pyricularia oryzae]|nr:hypothetical protein MCOR34_010180 [Pyricularia oryzae]KAI6461005.1 hypothetical protein MCOR17_006492 [Pyricularia oryzae]KAI6582522.1 hypothetical protein MCOR04_005236 [Pyricularia oryzae]KAI6617973.1 hypothetical protein MCOR07_006781 [Pyricularia oryzae]